MREGIGRRVGGWMEGRRGEGEGGGRGGSGSASAHTESRPIQLQSERATTYILLVANCPHANRDKDTPDHREAGGAVREAEGLPHVLALWGRGVSRTSGSMQGVRVPCSSSFPLRGQAVERCGRLAGTLEAGGARTLATNLDGVCRTRTGQLCSSTTSQLNLL